MTHSTHSANSPTDADLLEARDNWTATAWAGHFAGFGMKAAGAARYSHGESNDVVKWALSKEFGGRCWYQGSGDCGSRAILLRNLQIDHIVQQKATAETLREALLRSTYQTGVFDVHDPGNLALVCGPCNQARGRKASWTAAMQDLQVASEEARDRLINRVAKWHREAKIDHAVLTAIEGADLTDNETWEVVSDMVAQLIEKRAGREVSLDCPVRSQSTQFSFTLEPSDELVEAFAEWHAENFAEEMRIDRRSADLEDNLFG